MGGCINEPLAVRKEKPASRAAFPGVEKFYVAPVDVHAEDLIAFKRGPGGLEDEFCAIEGKIRFSILSTKREPLQVLQVRLTGFYLRTRKRVFGSN
jgi:hypothetical protein